jgi:hypothetical protein
MSFFTLWSTRVGAALSGAMGHRAVRGLDSAALLDAAEHGEQCRRSDAAYGFVADPGEDVVLQAAENGVPGGGDPGG